MQTSYQIDVKLCVQLTSLVRFASFYKYQTQDTKKTLLCSEDMELIIF